MAVRTKLVMVNRVIRQGGLDESGVDAATIDLARDLARRIDKVGADEAPLNLLRLYDSTLGRLQRAVDRDAAARRQRKPVEPAVTDSDGKPDLRLVESDPLEDFLDGALGTRAS